MASQSPRASVRLFYSTLGLLLSLSVLSSCGSGGSDSNAASDVETNQQNTDPDGANSGSTDSGTAGGPVVTARPAGQEGQDAAEGDLPIDTTSSPSDPAQTTSSTTAPVVAGGDGLLLYGYGVAGGWVDNRWDVGNWDSNAGSLGDWANKDVTIINIDGVQGTTKTGQPLLICDPIGSFGLDTQIQLGYSDNYPDYGYPEFGVISDWNPVPRTWVDVSPLPDVYLQTIESALSNAGLDPATAVVDQAIRVDLEGDGVDEVLISANDTYDYGTGATPEAYSVVLLRKVINEQVETAILFANYGEPGEELSAYFARSRIAGFADLNGDGKLEVITQEDYYEGGAIIAWEYVNDDLGIDVILSAGCGA